MDKMHPSMWEVWSEGAGRFVMASMLIVDSMAMLGMEYAGNDWKNINVERTKEYV